MNFYKIISRKSILRSLTMLFRAFLALSVLQAAVRGEGEREITSSFGEMPWDVILERVDRYILPLMPFWYEELHPYVSDPALTAHHMGEHNVYKSYMNMYLKQWRDEEPDNEFAKESILNIVMHLEKVPAKFQNLLRHFGGGFVNHCFYFGILSPNENGTTRAPQGQILQDINDAFGSYKQLQELFEEHAKNLTGAGYVWLNRVPGDPKSLTVSSTNNQNSPVMAGITPILVLDFWEHAYYLKNNYRKWDHFKDYWMIVDWESVEKLDKWWKNLDEEQVAADKRVEDTKENFKAQKEAIERKAEEESGKDGKKKSEL